MPHYVARLRNNKYAENGWQAAGKDNCERMYCVVLNGFLSLGHLATVYTGRLGAAWKSTCLQQHLFELING